jgi:hypothetical protein
VNTGPSTRVLQGRKIEDLLDTLGMDTFAASNGVERKRKAGEICHEVSAVAPENVEQIASVVVIAAAQSEIVGSQEKKAKFRRLTIVFRKDRDAANGRDRRTGTATASPEKMYGHDAAGGDMADSAASARISNDDTRSPSISAPADDDNHTDPVIGGDQTTGPSSAPPESSADLPLLKPSRGCRVTFICGDGRERARQEKTNGRAGVVGVSGCAAGISNDDDSQLPSISAPADAVFGDGGLTDLAVGEHHQVSPSGSGRNVCAGDQEAGPSSSSESSVDLTPSPRIKATEALEQPPPVPVSDTTTTDGDQRSPLDGHLQVFLPAIDDVAQARDQDSVSSSPNPSDDQVSADNTGGGGIDLHRLGRRIAMEMDDNALRLEVARQFHADRQLRRAVVSAAPPARFSLQLSVKEAMEDVDAVSVPVPEDVEPEAPAGHRDGKGRRGG